MVFRFIFFISMLLPFFLIGQKQEPNIQINYQTYLTGHPLILTDGISVNYKFSLKETNTFSLSIIPEFTFLNEKDIKNHLMLSPLLLAVLKIHGNFTIGVFTGPSFIYTNTLYDNYGFRNGSLIPKSSNAFYIRPQAGIQLNLFKVNFNNISISPTFRLNTLKWNESYNRNLFEGYKAGCAAGIIIDLKK